MHHSGVAIALATDGAASNDAQCMTEVIKIALLLSRLNGEPSTWLSPDDVLDMAFKPGPRVFMEDMDPLNGALTAGAPADIAAFDLTDPLLIPANDLAAQMTFSGGALRARHVWVGGEQLLRDGEPTKMDRFALAAQASRLLGERRPAP
jgi:5-methylthioadenosine/S-adenosylhomocysteine deaminase